MSNWYTEKSQDEKIMQGDIFINCPIYIPDHSGIAFATERWIEARISYNTYLDNIVVLTQACDLEWSPVDHVLVCSLTDINDLNFPAPKNHGEKTTRKKYIRQIYEGKKPNLHLIGKHVGSVEMNFQVVDFSSIFSLPYQFLNNYKQFHGIRLQLNIPHREYLSQRFGNFYSRIGLPNDDHISERDLIAACKDDTKEYQQQEA